MPAPGFLTSPCSRDIALQSPDPQRPGPVPTLPPDPAPAGQQQWQAERQKRLQARARHGPGDRLVAQGRGLSRGRSYRISGWGYLRPRTWELKEKGQGVGEGAGSRHRPLGGATRAGHPQVPPRPAARGQRLKLNSGRRVPGLGKGEEEGRGEGAAGSAARPASLPGPGTFDLALGLDAGPSLEPSVRRSVAGSHSSSSARSRDPESLVTHLGGERTSGFCT